MCSLSTDKESVGYRKALIMDGYDVRIRVDNMPFMFLESRPSKTGVSLGKEVMLEAPSEIG